MAITFKVPTGPKNLEQIFATVDFTNVAEYYVTVVDQGSSAVILTSPRMIPDCCCDESMVARIFFLNYAGDIDGINMKRILEETETNSTSWKKANAYPLEKWDGGFYRFNVNSNETVSAETACYSDEEDQEWLKELLGTPNAWVQWTGTQGQDDNYVPIIIVDGKFVTRKLEGRHTYVLQLQFKYANENLILRN